MIKTAPHSALSPQMWCIKKKYKRLVCTHLDLLARICKLVDRKKFGLICFPRLIYCEQEPLLLLNLNVHLCECTYKAISTRYKICFTPKSLNFSMGASLLAVAKSIYQRTESWMHTLKASDKIIMEPLKSCREETNSLLFACNRIRPFK